MKKVNVLCIALLLAIGVCCSGCLDTKVAPFTQNDIITDDKVIGRWFPIAPKTDEEPPIYTVVPLGDNLYRLLMQEKGKESMAQLTLFKLNNQTYLSVSYSDSEEYDTFLYYWENDALKLKGFDQKQFIELSKKEKLDLDYKVDEQNMLGSEVSINATTEKLRSFIEQYGVQVFSDQGMEMKRLNE